MGENSWQSLSPISLIFFLNRALLYLWVIQPLSIHELQNYESLTLACCGLHVLCVNLPDYNDAKKTS